LPRQLYKNIEFPNRITAPTLVRRNLSDNRLAFLEKAVSSRFRLVGEIVWLQQ